MNHKPNGKTVARLRAMNNMLAQGMTYRAIATKLGVPYSTIQSLGTRYFPERIIAGTKIVAKERDPSGLTDEQLEQAERLGISPGRLANLLTCPKGGVGA